MTYEVFNPDGIHIRPAGPFATKKEALEKYREWKAKIEKQGQYIRKDQRKLCPSVLDNNCYLVAYKGKNNPHAHCRISELLPGK